MSIALVSTTLGAVAGPNLVEPLGDLAAAWDLPRLAGPFVLAAVAYLAAGAVLLTFLRPDPLVLARRWHASDSAAGSIVDDTPDNPRTVYVGAVIMVLTQVAMVAIMTMTPVHMRDHHHGLGAVGLVISLHIAAMFLPSLVTGVLVDRWGRAQVAIASAATLLAAGLVAAFGPGDSMAWMVLALVLLGLGWNLGLISGTALVVDGTAAASRPRVQGTIDVSVALAGAGGGALSGVVVSASSYATLSIACGLLSLALLPALLWARRTD